MVKTAPSNAGAVGSISGQGAKTYHMPCGQKTKAYNRSSIVTKSIKTIESTLKKKKSFK